MRIDGGATIYQTPFFRSCRGKLILLRDRLGGKPTPWGTHPPSFTQKLSYIFKGASQPFTPIFIHPAGEGWAMTCSYTNNFITFSNRVTNMLFLIYFKIDLSDKNNIILIQWAGKAHLTQRLFTNIVNKLFLPTFLTT